ncbi:Protein of unknown function [Gryllus bimaculatus]|nr:Protein of unknown function [Gryllus bimaculatus]
MGRLARSVHSPATFRDTGHVIGGYRLTPKRLAGRVIRGRRAISGLPRFNDPLRWKFTVEEVRANWFFALSVALLMQRSYFQRRVHPAWERWEWNFFSTARFQLIQFIATSQAEFVSDKGKS